MLFSVFHPWGTLFPYAQMYKWYQKWSSVKNSADEIKEENLAYFFLAVFLLQA